MKNKINYNPYDLIKIKLNDEEILARPANFSASIISGCYDSLGRLIVPTSILATCNKCGKLLEVNVDFQSYPFEVLNISCECFAFKDPFVPIKFPNSNINNDKIENLDDFENDLDDFIINVVNIKESKKNTNIKIEEL